MLLPQSVKITWELLDKVNKFVNVTSTGKKRGDHNLHFFASSRKIGGFAASIITYHILSAPVAALRRHRKTPPRVLR